MLQHRDLQDTFGQEQVGLPVVNVPYWPAGRSQTTDIAGIYLRNVLLYRITVAYYYYYYYYYCCCLLVFACR
jgi:hypothetical protein